MKKYVLLVVTLITLCLTACGNENGMTGNRIVDINNAEEVSENYTVETNDVEEVSENSKSEEEDIYFLFRELPEPVYVPEAETFSGGSGTAEDPYQIATKEELALFSVLVNAEDSLELGYREKEKEYKTCSYILTQDIVVNEGDAEKWSLSRPQYDWKPIGATFGAAFEGDFDGNGHTISGIYINVDASEPGEHHPYGLFGINRGNIRNVNIENTYMCTSGYTTELGGIAGINYGNYGKDSQVTNCSVHAYIETYDASCGGVVGENGSIVSECSFSGKILALKAESFSVIGGIVGRLTSAGTVKNCMNVGSILTNNNGAENVGGIVGRAYGGTVTDCHNSGILTGFPRLGGIAGYVSSNNMGAALGTQNGEIYLTGCSNEGELTGTTAGGIVGKMRNEKGSPIVLIECNNSGKVNGISESGGMIGGADDYGIEISVINCHNTGDLCAETVGGIISEVNGIAGKLIVNNCYNSGRLMAEEFSAGGMVGQFYIHNDVSAQIQIENCANEGEIGSKDSAGGMIGCLTGTISTLSEDAEIRINDCVNHGKIITYSGNTYIGGIIGGHGVEEIPTTIYSCVNVGDLEVNSSISEGESTGATGITLTNMCGGIVGRVGETLFLSTDMDHGSDVNINKDDAVVKIENCFNMGQFQVSEDDKVYCYQIGGIIGNCSAEDGCSVQVTDCGYANAERGLGTLKYSDVGIKMSELEIENKIYK